MHPEENVYTKFQDHMFNRCLYFSQNDQCQRHGGTRGNDRGSVKSRNFIYVGSTNFHQIHVNHPQIDMFVLNHAWLFTSTKKGGGPHWNYLNMGLN